ncbi:MAG: ABC transporter ATP-binding protein [Pseudomonadota bacterium]
MFEAESVTRRFGTVTAVDELTLKIAPGELFCLLGANGAGKTTTINLFLGFLKPDDGMIRVGSVDPSSDPRAARAQLAYIPENVALYPQLTGLENLKLFCDMGGTTLDSGRAVALLERTGLGAAETRRRVDGYSKGMRQKVGLAIAYARGAGGLLLDEPLSGLDPSAASEFCDELIRFCDQGAAVLMSTHDLFRAKALGGTIGIMRSGRLVEVLKADDVDARDLEALYLRLMRGREESAETVAA